MSHQDVYDWLCEINRPWGRYDECHIYVWAAGYKTHFDDGHHGVEKRIRPAGFVMISEEFCPENGQTKATYKHRPPNSKE